MHASMNHSEPLQIARKFWLALECAALFLGVPAVVGARWVPVPVIPLLLVMTAGCWLALQWHHKIDLRSLLRPKVPAHEWQRILATYAIALPCLLVLLWIIQPAAMFFFMCQHTVIWLLIMIGYPVLSVFPQELIYRAFLFERYRPLFGNGNAMILASATVFGFGHVVFHNWISVALTFVGGFLFAKTYQRTKSLLVVSVEHALYGCAIFTIGYGQFFFDRFLWLFR
jgi:membrane protease YdiL (CAAX protease family)